ncbi:unnamed protein product [Lactuca virosa]|uniref:Uncharacterized protein n=1 Tax=Lactuca virosa TaxID=75947 RepID=A0AAU9NJ58_9ASTR|nr:unnamed protein product [Lactuca virosa]
MAASSETPSVAKQTASTVMLNIKPNQNLALDLDSSKYVDSLNSMVERLRYSPLAQALTMAESVPLVHLSKAFSTTNYKQSEVMITFEIDSHKTSISKSRFCRLLGFTATDDLVNPETISSSAIIEMFCHTPKPEWRKRSGVDDFMCSITTIAS